LIREDHGPIGSHRGHRPDTGARIGSTGGKGSPRPHIHIMDIKVRLSYDDPDYAGHVITSDHMIPEELVECLSPDEIIEFLGFDVESTFALQVIA